MPGLCGIIGPRHDAALTDRFSQMLNRLRHQSWYEVDQYSNVAAGAALGRVSLGFLQTGPQPIWNADRSVCCAMAGEIYKDAEIVQRLRAAGSRSERIHDGSASHAELLLHGFLSEGREFFRQLNCTFVAAIWEANKRRLTLINDRFGTKPLYYSHQADRFLFASEIKSILSNPDVSRAPNPRGVAQFFSFGQLLCDDTLLADVKALPPAAWITYDQTTDRLNIDRYRRLSEIQFDPAQTQAEFYDRVDAVLVEAVRVRTENSPPLGISLSGGLDSRTILGLIDHGSVPIKSVSMGVRGGLDHLCAQRLADLANRDHHCSYLDKRFLENYPRLMRRMVHLTDGHYLDQCIVLPTLPKYRELGIQVLLRGHAGELAHMDKAYCFSLDAEGWAIRDEASLRMWLRRHLSAFILEGLSHPLLTGMSSGALQALADESLDEAMADSAGVDPPLHRIWHLFITERLRRETAMSMAKIGAFMETRLPFLDNDVIAALLSGRPEWKRGDDIQAEILRRCRPEFLSVINANTGIPLGAAAWRGWVAKVHYRVLGKLGLPGYQPYERLGLWLRRELRPWVGKTLLGERTLARGIFDADSVREIIKQHHSRNANHTALLMALLIFEFGQREFIDGDEDYSEFDSQDLSQSAPHRRPARAAMTP
jgi:asparagine synthase (glutamine-hydrolysing)